MVFWNIELIQQVYGRLQTSQSHQKSYEDIHCLDLEFQVWDFVLLKISPWKCVVWFRKRGKLGPIFIGPFSILSWVGMVTYQFDLPSNLS